MPSDFPENKKCPSTNITRFINSNLTKCKEINFVLCFFNFHIEHNLWTIQAPSILPNPSTLSTPSSCRESNLEPLQVPFVFP